MHDKSAAVSDHPFMKGCHDSSSSFAPPRRPPTKSYSDGCPGASRLPDRRLHNRFLGSSSLMEEEEEGCQKWSHSVATAEAKKAARRRHRRRKRRGRMSASNLASPIASSLQGRENDLFFSSTLGGQIVYLLFLSSSAGTSWSDSFSCVCLNAFYRPKMFPRPSFHSCLRPRAITQRQCRRHPTNPRGKPCDCLPKNRYTTSGRRRKRSRKNSRLT